MSIILPYKQWASWTKISEIQLFWRARWRGMRISLSESFRSPGKVLVLFTIWGLLLFGVYFLAEKGIEFIYKTEGLGPFLVKQLWFTFLFVVMVMLIISQLWTVYSTLVRSSETSWWTTLPISPRIICRTKWIESSVYSSWSIVVLVLPVCVAYLSTLGRSFWSLGWICLLFIPFIGIITALTTLFFLLILRIFNRSTIPLVFFALAVITGTVLYFFIIQGSTQGDDWWIAAIQILPRMHLLSAPWLPSSWVAKALDAGINWRWTEVGIYAAFLWMTLLMAWRMLDHVAAVSLLHVLRRHGYAAGDDVKSIWRSKNMHQNKVDLMPWWTKHPFLTALVKDVLLVIRDPLQWGQAVVFFGLLGIWYANIHRMADLTIKPAWRIGITSLNMASTLLVFGSLAVRFIFPQMSLEGRSLWLLRIIPHGMRQLMWAKMCLYSAIAIIIIESLLFISMRQLGVPAFIQWWILGVGVFSAIAIVGLTVGLGAYWANPKIQDAARIVSSSNGAFVLVLMLGYVGSVIVALVVAWTSWVGDSPYASVIASLGVAALSIAAAYYPVSIGFRRLEHLEDTS